MRSHRPYLHLLSLALALSVQPPLPELVRAPVVSPPTPRMVRNRNKKMRQKQRR